MGAAVGARCAARDGRFEAYHEIAFANQRGENLGAFARDRLVAIAELAGLDATSFEACLAEPALAQQVAAETEVGDGLGIQATPTIIVGSQQLRGVPTWETLIAAVEAAEAIP